MNGRTRISEIGRFRRLPLQRKLMVVIMATTAAALVLSGISILIFDSVLFRGYLERDLSTLADITADNSTAALSFEDPHAASETLGALRARTHVVTACIYRRNGSVLATYHRAGTSSACPDNEVIQTIHITGADMTLVRPIMLNNRRIGTLTMLYDLRELYDRLRLYGATVLFLLLSSSLLALMLSSRLSAIIATPISQLVQTTTAISETKDYSVRAAKFSADELGVLVDTFNDMLAGIQTRDNELREALLTREQALEDAQNARDFLRTTLTSIGDAVISTDVDGCVVFANRVAQGLLRLPESELTGRRLDDVFSLIHEFDRKPVESPLSKVLREPDHVTSLTDTVLIAGDGTEMPIDNSVAPIRGDGGSIHGMVLVFRDTSARRRAIETSRLLASIVESSGDAIIGYDLNGRITSWNSGAENMFGYCAVEMTGSSTSAIALAGQDEMPGVLQRICRGERIDQYQGVRRTKAGKVMDVSVTVSPIYDALGRIVGASQIARDTTEQVRAASRLAELNADLQRSNERLARSNEDLERFAFIASHDLQEPLRMITLYSQLLVKQYPAELADQAEACISNIVGGTKRMRELLADLLAFTEIGGRPEDPPKPVDLNLVVQKVKENLKASIEETGAEVTADPLPVLVVNDSHFVSLFQNLIGNALKYRSGNAPRIHISLSETGAQLRFAVADNGSGIAPQYHDKIFVAFKRLHGKSIPGTGIGLAICQRVVQRYGGRIWVESQVGQGSTFIFTLPDIRYAEGAVNDRRTS
jgi:PAS domain S-box-containing protein